MDREFVITSKFDAKWNTLGLDDSDLMRLQSELLLDPKAGKVIKGTGGIRKIRFAQPNRGKSGSARVIYVDFIDYEKLFLLTAYAKNEKEKLSYQERISLKKVTDIIKQELKNQRR